MLGSSAGMIASVGSSSALSANVIIQRQDELSSGCEDYELAPAGNHVEGASRSHLLIAGYGRLHILVNQVGNVWLPPRWKATKRALQYLWHTKYMGPTYGEELGGNTKLSTWVDADYGIWPDMRRSISVVMRGKDAISWLSRIQRATTAASARAQY